MLLLQARAVKHLQQLREAGARLGVARRVIDLLEGPFRWEGWIGVVYDV
jgi:hypothetical protein